MAAILTILAVGFWQSPVAADDVPAVAAAANLQFALRELNARFGLETGRSVRVSYGSSGNFRRQIAQGAPFEIFLSADERYVHDLAQDGLTVGRGVAYALGRIVVFAPNGSSVKPDSALQDLAAALEDGRLRRFAIANPDHAPYGRAAHEALASAGLWTRIQKHLVLGENAAQAAQFAVSGSAQGGIVPYSLALAPAMKSRGTFALLPSEWHAPLRQRMVLLKGAGDTARLYYDYLQSASARAALSGFGFALPENVP